MDAGDEVGENAEVGDEVVVEVAGHCD
jgi:hypothetical protein